MTSTTYRVKTPDGTTPEVQTYAQARRDLHAAEVARAAIGATGPVFVQTVTRGPSACAPQCGCD